MLTDISHSPSWKHTRHHVSESGTTLPRVMTTRPEVEILTAPRTGVPIRTATDVWSGHVAEAAGTDRRTDRSGRIDRPGVHRVNRQPCPRV